MKSFEKSIADVCGLEISALAHSYKYSVFGGHTAVIEGHGGLIAYTEEQIVFKVGKSKLAVNGDVLFICQLNKDSAVVRGEIHSVEYVQ
ncbi:MAG: YabP/YqfC family sporulation protein [Corallococcus sp.]|nr:YabP/YqfC family sporulation protein [Corallococcus sp.]